MKESATRLHLAIWRPARLARPIVAFSEGNLSAAGSGPLNLDLLYEQIYSWSTQEEIWGGILNPELTNMLRTALIETFDPYSEPLGRSMNRFADAVEKLGRVVHNQRNSIQWSDCESLGDKSDPDTGLRADLALALYRHFSWVLRTFENVPGAMVTIR